MSIDESNLSISRRQLLGLAATCALGGIYPELAWSADTPSSPGTLPTVKPEFFGATMHWPVRAPYATNYPSVPIATWRAILPELHWFSLEPNPGEWKFDKLDIAMRLMEARNIDVLLTLGQTPTWASSNPSVRGSYIYGQLSPPSRLSDWENYIRTVAERYRGRIRHYELWNEPDFRETDGSKAEFTAAQMVELGNAAYRIIKEVDPEARLTSPSTVAGERGINRLDAYFAAGGDKCTDIVSFHYYGLPEQISQYHTALLKVMKRHRIGHLPVWNTEFGYLIADPKLAPSTYPISGGSFSRILPDSEAAIWLARSLIIGASAGIERFYWFMWDGRFMSLTNLETRQVNAAGAAIGTLAKWLTHRQVGALQRYENVVYCPIYESGKLIARALWTQDYKPLSWNPPKEWRVTSVSTLDEGRIAHPAAESLKLSASPLIAWS